RSDRNAPRRPPPCTHGACSSTPRGHRVPSDFCPSISACRKIVSKVLPVDSGRSTLFSRSDLQGTKSTFVPALPGHPGLGTKPQARHTTHEQSTLAHEHGRRKLARYLALAHLRLCITRLFLST